MDYLTRAKYDHGALRMMLDVQKEILARLAKARGVNLIHLEEILRFWKEFLCREHLLAEEEFLFTALRRLDHPALAELVADHDQLCSSLKKLEEIAGELRAGKPNSGREFLETGRNFGMLLERHLNKENSIFAELTVKEHGIAAYPRPLPPEGLFRLTRLFSLLNELAGEYLGREYDIAWLQVEKGKEPATSGGTGEESPEDKGETEEESPAGKEATVEESPSGALGGRGEGEPAGEEGQTIEESGGADVEEESGTAGGERERAGVGEEGERVEG